MSELDLEAAARGKPKFWTMNFGQAVTLVVFVVGVIYGASAFATKSNADIESDKTIAAQLVERSRVIDDRTAKLEARMTGVETGISFIRESQTRTETTMNEILKGQTRK